jgi:putative nucleotidyltransferase with HDIG domain
VAPGRAAPLVRGVRPAPAARPGTPGAPGAAGAGPAAGAASACRAAARPGQQPRRGLARSLVLAIGAVMAAGVLSALPDLLAQASFWGGRDAPWSRLALFAAFTVLSQHVAVDVGDKRGKISIAAIPVMGASFLYGGMGGLVTAGVFAVWAKLRAHSPYHRMLFNFGNALLAASGATWTFRLLVGLVTGGQVAAGPAGAAGVSLVETSFDHLLVPAVLAGLVYYALNHLGLCLVRGLDERRRPRAVWAADYQWLWPHFAVLGVLGLVVAVGYVRLGLGGVVALAAPAAMMQVAMKQYMERTGVFVAELQHVNARLQDSYEATLHALSRALDTRDEETEEHSVRVQRYSELLARRLGLAAEEIEHISRGALLHDIGKIGVPDAVLLKPGLLTESEIALMRKHPTIGYAMITHIPFLVKAAAIVLHHHEAYDGSGYPSGLAGDQIPLGARIFAVADTFDAITSDRPYRQARPAAAAREEIARRRGSQFDPRVVDALLSLSDDELMAPGEPRPAAARLALPERAPAQSGEAALVLA